MRRRPAQAVTAAAKPQGHSAPQRIHVTVHDRRGKTEQLLTLPIVLGKDGHTHALQKGGFGMDVDATYVSRQQLLVFEALGDIYCFVPASASLTCTMGNTHPMRPQQLYPLQAGQMLSLLGGVPVDGQEAPPERTDHADFPLIELRTLAATSERSHTTPRPKAVM